MAMIRQLSTVLVLTGALFATGAPAATVIDTVATWDGNSGVGNWGDWTVPLTQSVYGQSITAPAGTSMLTGFTFYMRDRSQINYDAFVYAWDGDRITGPALFSLTGQSLVGGGTNDYLPVSVSTSVAVDPGSQYMLFFSTIGLPQPPQGFTVWGFHYPPYAEGQFRYFDTDDFAALSSTPWDQINVIPGDLAFTATFEDAAVVPVPGTLGLMLSGAVALGFLARRRRNA